MHESLSSPNPENHEEHESENRLPNFEGDYSLPLPNSSRHLTIPPDFASQLPEKFILHTPSPDSIAVLTPEIYKTILDNAQKSMPPAKFNEFHRGFSYRSREASLNPHNELFVPPYNPDKKGTQFLADLSGQLSITGRGRYFIIRNAVPDPSEARKQDTEPQLNKLIRQESI